jgi:hypothetical protein
VYPSNFADVLPGSFHQSPVRGSVWLLIMFGFVLGSMHKLRFVAAMTQGDIVASKGLFFPHQFGRRMVGRDRFVISRLPPGHTKETGHSEEQYVPRSSSSRKVSSNP